MTRLLLDRELLQRLNLTAPLEMCDESGSVLGYFVPASAAAGISSREPPPLSAEEWQRRESEPGGRTTAEILRDLESRP